MYRYPLALPTVVVRGQSLGPYSPWFVVTRPPSAWGRGCQRLLSFCPLNCLSLGQNVHAGLLWFCLTSFGLTLMVPSCQTSHLPYLTPCQKSSPALSHSTFWLYSIPYHHFVLLPHQNDKPATQETPQNGFAIANCFLSDTEANMLFPDGQHFPTGALLG